MENIRIYSVNYLNALIYTAACTAQEIFDNLDSCDFFIIKPQLVGDFLANIKESKFYRLGMISLKIKKVDVAARKMLRWTAINLPASTTRKIRQRFSHCKIVKK